MTSTQGAGSTLAERPFAGQDLAQTQVCTSNAYHYVLHLESFTILKITEINIHGERKADWGWGR